MRTIRITGKGEIKVKPDVTRITVTLEGQNKNYEKTLQKSSEDTDSLKKILNGFGFERSDLKTLQFNVDTEYETVKERGTYNQRFVGYKYHHVMKVEFPSDNDRLGKILFALANSSVQPEFRISYTVSDPEAAKNALLANAIADAKEKAAVLSQAAGVALKEIQSIDYSWGKIDFEVDQIDFLCSVGGSLAKASGQSSYDLDVEPDDISKSDTVTVIWKIG